MIVDTPNKNEFINKRKKRRYEFKKGSSLLIYFPRLTEMSDHLEDLTNDSIVRHACQQASNIIIWVAKQNRFKVIKGYFTDYQMDMMEVLVENRYYNGKKNPIKERLMPWALLDVSEVPPKANYVTH